jgi:dnd system-associated protein 4
MRDRIRPIQELEKPVLESLKDSGLFATKQKGMMFAAALGYSLRGKGLSQETTDPKFGEGIRIEYFASVLDDGFIDALAVASTGSLDVLAEDRQEERIELFERYAAAGLREMKKQIVDAPMEHLNAMLAVLDEVSARSSSSSEMLPGLANLM